MLQQLLDATLVVLVQRRLTLDVVNDETGGVVQDRLGLVADVHVRRRLEVLLLVLARLLLALTS